MVYKKLRVHNFRVFQVLKGNDFEMYLKAFKAWETVCPYSTQEV